MFYLYLYIYISMYINKMLERHEYDWFFIMDLLDISITNTFMDDNMHLKRKKNEVFNIS